jgi:3'-phosphoadenosine 5'-phosphosulfate sulfotransferase (PAPS reductase)/FAD synthetase
MSELHLPGIAPDPRPGPDPVTEARTLLDEAIREHDPVAIWVAFSGGKDSTVLAHIAMQDERVEGCLLIDTGVALQEAHDHARAVCDQYGWPLHIERTNQSYDDAVREHGFPGPAQHSMMYRRLKERAFAAFTRDIKAERNAGRMGRLLLIGGVRKYESTRRMKLTDPITRDGGRVWVSPLFWWRDEERDAYLAGHDLPISPIYGTLCNVSGDCLCGAMADPHGAEEWANLAMFYPEMHARLERLQREAAACGVHAKWGTRPPDRVPEDPNQCVMYACTNCEAAYDRRREAA